MSPTAAMNVAAVIRLTPGTVISRLIAGEASACSAIARSRIAISPLRKSIWRKQPSTVSRSSPGNSSAPSHARPPLPNASVTGGRPLRAHQHCVDLVLGTRALTHELRATGQAPAQRPRLIVRQPAAAKQPGGEQPR
jgi:hypothetical protein